MKRLVSFALVMTAFAWGPVLAEEDVTPIDRPVATFTRPEAWPGYPDESGILTVSADGKVKIALTLVNARDQVAAERFMLNRFAKDKVTAFPSSRHVIPTRRIGGHTAQVVGFAAQDYEGPTQLVLTFSKLDRPGSYLVISELAPASALNANSQNIAKMLDSVKILK